jgi:hypothetical protein
MNGAGHSLSGATCAMENQPTIIKYKKIYEIEMLSPYVFLRLSTGSILIPALRQRSARQPESTVLQQVRANIL